MGGCGSCGEKSQFYREGQRNPFGPQRAKIQMVRPKHFQIGVESDSRVGDVLFLCVQGPQVGRVRVDGTNASSAEPFIVI